MYHHTPHRDSVTAPHRRPNLRSRLHLATTGKGKSHEKSIRDLWWHLRGKKKKEEEEKKRKKTNKLQELITQNKVHIKICPETDVVFNVIERLHSTTNTLNMT